MPAKFTANRSGIRAMCATEDMGRAMERRAERGKAFAEGIAPVQTGRYKTGHILLGSHNDPTGIRRHRAGGNLEPLPPDLTGGGFHVSRFTTTEGYVGARLTATAPYSAFLEWGTSRMPAQHILGRSLDAMR